jgi:hypothetical protein
MKQIITLIAAIFIFTVVNAGGKPYKTPLKVNAEKAVLNVTLQAAGKVSISWSAVEEETTKTIYEIQKRTDSGEFKNRCYIDGRKISYLFFPG